MRKIVFFSVCFIFSIMTFAQFNVAWKRQYNGSGHKQDYSNAVAVDDSGNVCITGFSQDGFYGKVFTTIKFNSSGTQKWVNDYQASGNYHGEGKAIAFDKQGNVYVTGVGSFGQINNNISKEDFVTIKYNPAGIQQWIKYYNTIQNVNYNGSDMPYCVAVDDSANVFVGGVAGTVGNTSWALVKYNSQGIEKWVSIDTNIINGIPYRITVDKMGNIILTGYSNVNDYCTVKYSQTGNMLWKKRYNGPGNNADGINALITDTAGNIYVTGKTTITVPDCQFTTIKYLPDSTLSWIANYNSAVNYSADIATGIGLDKLGNIYIAGTSDTGLYQIVCATLIKYNNLGLQQWIKFSSEGYMGTYRYGDGLVVDSIGNSYLLGTYSGFFPGIFLEKFNSNGTSQGIIKIDSVYNSNSGGGTLPWTNPIALDYSGNIYITGQIRWYFPSNTDSSNMIIIKLVPTITQIKENNFHKEALIYPNPFSQYTNLKIKSDYYPCKLKVSIYDIVGNYVMNDEYTIYSHDSNIKINRNNLPKGLYFYKISDDREILGVGKLVVE